MKYLWTPWRMAYIKGEKKPIQGCIFCKANDEDDYIVARSEHVYVILNRYPYSGGHLMIVPYMHVGSQEDLPVEALTDLMVTTNRAMRTLRELHNPPAFNLGANIGAAAGAGIAEHYHLHIVPRWPGDANFMTSVGDTRIIPDTLENTHQQLQAIWKRLYE